MASLQDLIDGGADDITLRVYDDLGHSLAHGKHFLGEGYPRSLFSWITGWAREETREAGGD